MEFNNQLRRIARSIDEALDEYLTGDHLSGPGPASERLISAMRHGVLSGGKRLRPLLLSQTADVFKVEPGQIIPACLAVELVHCYSLIHDDLPAMDDDDLRRGKPTVHKLFDDSTAILAGDSLLTHAFGLLADPNCHPDAQLRTQLICELVAGAGAGGMAGGQMRDLEGENARISDRDISIMQQMKTGALIRASVRMGAMLGGANAAQLANLTAYAEATGWAFQLGDDILDETATPDQMGKATGKDSERGKSTLVARLGVEAAKQQLAETVSKALAALDGFGEEADGLRATAKYFGERQS